MAKAETVKVAYTPHAGQTLFHNSTAKIRVLACGRRWGKDRSSVNEAIKLVFMLWNQRRGKPTTLIPLVTCWFVAPDYTLLEDDFNQFLAFVPQAVVSKVTNSKPKVVEMCDGDIRVEFRTGDDPTKLVGGSGIDVLVMTESGLIPSLAWEQSLPPALGSPGRAGYALINGTPKGINSWFHKLYLHGQDPLIEGIESWGMPSLTSPHIDPAFVERQRLLMPDRWWRQEYGAEWLEDSGGVFAGVEACKKGQLDSAEPGWKPEKDRQYAIGVDLGKHHDFTVIIVIDVELCHVVAFYRSNHVDYKFQKPKIKEFHRRYNKAPVLVDSTNNESVLEDLIAWEIPAQGYHFSAPAKRALIDHLAIGIQEQRLSFPDIPVLINELKLYEYQATKGGNLRTAAPKGEDFFDDTVIALALSWWMATKLGAFAVDSVPFAVQAVSGAANSYEVVREFFKETSAARALPPPSPEDEEEDDGGFAIESTHGSRAQNPLTSLMERLRRW